jgi:polysaccharide deacetylase 2 family uncharacterized protein YibQ
VIAAVAVALDRVRALAQAALRERRWQFLVAGVALIALGAGLGWLGRNGEIAPGSVAVKLPPVNRPTAKLADMLAPAPDPELVADSPDGQLPIIGKDGREPWRVYARPFAAEDTRPRLALLVSGLGLDLELTKAAISMLPGAVTFGFAPYAHDLPQLVAAARQAGHEVVLDLPLEPLDYPRQDPGPLTLLTSVSEQENSARLDRVMASASGYVGLVGKMGARFSESKPSLTPLLQELRSRGLLFVDNRPTDDSLAAPLARQLGVPVALADRRLDTETPPVAIDAALGELENTARQAGAALGLLALTPASLDRLAAEIPSLAAKGIALAPVSAIVNRQPQTATP